MAYVQNKEERKNIMAEEVKVGDTVKVCYRGTLNDGSEFDVTTADEPLTFQVGSQDIIRGFSRALLGMKVGEKKHVHLKVEEAYGPYRDFLVFKAQPEAFPGHKLPELGTVFEMGNEKGKVVKVTVRSLGEGYAVLDANHYLAGQELNFDIELLEIVKS